MRLLRHLASDSQGSPLSYRYCRSETRTEGWLGCIGRPLALGRCSGPGSLFPYCQWRSTEASTVLQSVITEQGVLNVFIKWTSVEFHFSCTMPFNQQTNEFENVFYCTGLIVKRQCKKILLRSPKTLHSADTLNCTNRMTVCWPLVIFYNISYAS